MRRNRVVISAALIVPLAILPGCAPEAYRRSADREVYRILRDRKGSALGYQPEVVAPDAPAPSARRADYQKIPATTLPPQVPPPVVTPILDAVPVEPLGPRFGEAPAEDVDELEALEGGEEDTVGPQPLGHLKLGPPAPGRPTRRLDLFGALRFGVQNSREYQDEMEELYLSALDVTLERHLFSPRPFARVGAEYTGGQADVNYRSALAATASAGVRQRLPYGGEITAETLVRFVDTLSGEVEDGESAEIALSGSIPLLRGAGLVNLEPLIASERELVYAVRDFESFRRLFAVDIASRYFSLLSQQQSIANRLQNLATLGALLERARALFAADRLSGLDVQRAEQSLLTGQNRLIDARVTYANGLDTFKIALGMDVNEPLEVIPVQLDVLVPDLDGPVAVETAYEYRLDLQTAEDRVGDAARRVEVARNGLLPDLDLTAGATTGNRAGEPARKLDSRTLEYSAGLQLDLPIDRVAERNRYRAALIGFDRAQRGLEETRDRVAAEVRADARGIRSAQSSLVIQGRSIALARRRLELASERLRLGIQGADTREVVEAQDALLTAQDNYERARANLQIQILEFLRDTGTLRVDPEAGELGQALFREAGALQTGAAMEMSK